MLGSPIYSEISWRGNSIFLIGSVHGAHTHFEEIVNRLEDFNPDVVLAEGNSLSGKAVEVRSARSYKQIDGSVAVKPLDTIPVRIADSPSSEESNYETVDEENYKLGVIDARKMGRTTTKIARWLTKYGNRDLWDMAVEGREDEMAEKIIEQIEGEGHSRIAVIFGSYHVFGIENIFDQL